MDSSTVFTSADRRMMIGVLGALSAAFLTVADRPREAGPILRHMTDLYRSDLARSLGYSPTDDECHEALQDQIGRLRLSLEDND